MAEENGNQTTSDANIGAGPDLAAIAVALGQSGKLDPRAAAFLEKQGALCDEQAKVAIAQERVLRLQADDLLREDGLRHWSLLIHHVSDVMKVSFELALAFITIAFATFIAAAIWNATNDRSLVIEAFQVPNDMADRGLTGQVVASQLLDRLSAMQSATVTSAPAQSYANGWGDNIKIQIPQTGLSIGEFNRDLRSWLGHETHISGEIFHDGDRISITARVGSGSAATFSGKPGDLNALIHEAAEQIYRQTQPYRYAIYILKGVDQSDDKVWERARQVFLSLATSADKEERAWALTGLTVIARFHDRDSHAAAADLHEALALVPDHPLALSMSCTSEMQLDHEEQALGNCRANSKELSGSSPGLAPRLAKAYRFFADATVAQLTGDFDLMRSLSRKALEYYGPKSNGGEDAGENLFYAFAAQHDRSGAQTALDSVPRIAGLDPQSHADRLGAIFWMDALLGNWPAVIASDASVERAQRESYPGSDNDRLIAAQDWPFLALAKAHLGDLAGATSAIDQTHADCDTCLRIRGDIAAIEKRWSAAQYWFAAAARQAPSIPFVYSDWGAMLLAEGDFDAAIAKFEEANVKGPHFADPLEMWGEALIAKNRSDLALAKFEEADKYAPKWGRLHLEWGEALLWTGDKAGATKQFGVAADLDLTPHEQSELARMRGTHG